MVDPIKYKHSIISVKGRSYEHYELCFVFQVKEFASYCQSKHKHFAYL